MRLPVDVERQVASSLYYLSDEGRIRKTANSFGLSRAVISIIIRTAIAIHLGPKYIKLPCTEAGVQDLVTIFFDKHGIPQFSDFQIYFLKLKVT